MSDYCISIVPIISVYPERQAKAKEILDWLVSLDIVKPTVSDCIFGSGNGYPIVDGAKRVATDPGRLPFGTGRS